MDVNKNTTRNLRIQRYLATLLFLGVVGVLAWLSTQYVYQADWTYGQRNSLTADSKQLLATLDDPVLVTAFARDQAELREPVREMIGRYQRLKPDIRLEFVNPDAEPDRVRELGVTAEGELRIAYQGRSERVQSLTEQAITNALLRVARQGERRIEFLTGHGERDPQGERNFDLGQFGGELARQGLNTQTLNLANTPEIPANTSFLVIASPQLDLLPGEIKLVREYLEKGGNLLWLIDPGETGGLERIAESFGLELLPGIIVDATGQLFGIQSPDFILIPDYPAHPVTRDLPGITLFPGVKALDAGSEDNRWEATPLLNTLERAWTETGPLEGQIRYDADTDEQRGPFTIAYAFTRQLNDERDESREQRVLVVGDGDFLSNAYLGNGANLDLGLNMVHWLSNDDNFISIRARSAPDLQLELSPAAQAAIGFGFLFILPGALLLAGVLIWLRRRKQ